jgi:hypothetical protein
MNSEETHSNGRSSRHSSQYRRNARWTNSGPCYADLNNRKQSNKPYHNNYSPGPRSSSTYNSNNYKHMDEIIVDEGFLNNLPASSCSSSRSAKLENSQLRIDCGKSKLNNSDKTDLKDITLTNQNEKDNNFTSTPTLPKEFENNLLSVSNLSKIFPSPESDLNNRNNLLAISSLQNANKQEQNDMNNSKLNHTLSSSNKKSQMMNQSTLTRDEIVQDQKPECIESINLNKLDQNKTKNELQIERQTSSKEIYPSIDKNLSRQQLQKPKMSASSPNHDIEASYEEQQEKVFKVNSFLQENVKYDVYVTHVENPTLFWIQLKDLSNEQIQFEKKIK